MLIQHNREEVVAKLEAVKKECLNEIDIHKAYFNLLIQRYKNTAWYKRLFKRNPEARDILGHTEFNRDTTHVAGKLGRIEDALRLLKQSTEEFVAVDSSETLASYL